MKHLILILALFSISYPSVAAISNVDVAALRQRDAATQITQTDQQAINKFLRTGLDRMFLAQEADEVIEIRRQLKEEKGADNASAYGIAYVDEVLKELQIAFKTAEGLQDESKKALINRNLMILAAELQSAKFCSLALSHIADKDQVVRYWAAKAITDPIVIQQLTKGSKPDTQMIDAIVKALVESVTAEDRPEIKKMIINFAGAVNNPAARKLLGEIADSRIKAYKNWTVTDEQIDISLLNSLGAVALTEQGDVKSEFGRKFAELYSLVFQRYIKGQGKLDPTSIEKVVTIIAEVDQECLDKTLAIKTGVLNAIRRKTGIEREYETLFGNRMMTGELALKFRFDYGKDASGNAVTAPPEIDPLPEAVAIK